MDPLAPDHERARLAAEWQANEAELERLRDLPAGATDPAARERALDERQDEIEGLLGEDYLSKNLG
jgi:hypothetical protein